MLNTDTKSCTTRVAGTETWQIRKPAVHSEAGVIVSQHHVASRVGARVLAGGGNAVDAAVAASFALGTVEPWMSGLGGGGYLLYREARTGAAWVVDFGMVAPAGLDPAAYALVEGTDSDLFSWPAVVEQRNVRGPLSIAVPGQVAGMAIALERFGTRGWAQTLAPAIELAERGIEVDWYASLKIAGGARDLARYAESCRVYLPDGFPPVAEWAGPLPHIRLGHLADTLRRIAAGGPAELYEGETASCIVDDIARLGGSLSLADLGAYRARVIEPERSQYRRSEVLVAPGLTAGPSLIHALELLAPRLAPGDRPDAHTYSAYVECLVDAYDKRLASLGDCDESRAPSCTTHLSVVDAAGNVCALTQTLLSVFGSKVMLPRTGILMNNGIMWFDPRPGKPNAIAPGARPLCNMCPTVLRGDDGCVYALGASGGRRIMPAIFQLTSFLLDYKMKLEEAFHTPRIDYSGAGVVTVNRALPAEIRAALAGRPTHIVHDGVYPAYFACPNGVAHDPNAERNTGAAFITSPWAAVVTAEAVR